VGGGVDTTVFAAFAAGFISFISPCVLPLVPGYLSAVSGVNVADMERSRREVVLPALVFCLSFTAVFVALGMVATGLGSTLQDNRDLLNKIAGALIVLMGVVFVLTLVVPRLNRELRPHALLARVSGAGPAAPLIAGAAFAIGWTPCIGPTLTAILNAAAVRDTVGEGGLLLAVYSLGLAIPFLVSAVAFHRASTVFRWLRDRYAAITAVSAVVLIAMGVLIFTGEITTLNGEAQRLLERVGLDDLYAI